MPGPGLLESAGWSVGYQAAQLCVFLALAAFLLYCATPRFPPSLQEVLQIVEVLGWESSFLFTGATSLAALLLIVPAVRLRLGQNARKSLGLRRLRTVECLLIVAAVLPLAVVSDQIYRWGAQLIAALRPPLQGLEAMSQLDTVKLIQRQAATTSYPIVLVAIALGPAIGEELVFRGLIGRGLTARWGMWGGALLTSLLFAAAHGTPAHALATLPIGMCLHYAYFVSGNLWAPILLHALINTVAITLMKFQADPALPDNLALFWASSGYLFVVGTLFWQMRPNPRGAGDAFFPGRRFPMLAACSIAAFTCVFVWARFSAAS